MKNIEDAREFHMNRSVLYSLVLLLMLGLIFSLTGCGSKNSVSLASLEKDMLAADTSLPEMKTVNNKSEDAEGLFSYLSDTAYKKIDAFFLSYSAEGLADEIAVVRVKKANDVTEVADSLNTHIENRKNLFRSYNKDQLERAEKAVLFTNGKDVVLIISDNPSLVKGAYEKAKTE
ncbi:MAG: DUF4358 domain-containing protein [Lachnospiraceae bacterium]|nr:DUF4358 domain-containing protein [Lachnospiraceae bacterium]